MALTSTLRPNTPPIQPAPAHFSLAQHQQFFLSNGIKILFFEDRSQPVVSISVVMRQGGLVAQHFDLPAGVQSFTAGMMTKGTTAPRTHRTAQDIADAMDYMGGTLAATSGWDSSSINLTVLAQYAEQGLYLMADSVFAPSFEAQEIERLRAQSLVGIQHNLEDPGYLATSALARGLYQQHPYSTSLYGTLHSMQKLLVDECRTYHAAVFAPEHCFVACAGNLTAEQAQNLLEQSFGTWQSHNRPAIPAPAIPVEHTAGVFAIVKDSAVQTTLRVGLPAPHRNDQDFIPMRVLNAILGGMFTSRLNSKLREEKGYTYGIHSSVDPRKLGSTLVIGTSVGNDVTAPALRDLLAEIDRIATEPVTIEELALAKNYMLGSFALATETPNQIVSLASGREIYGLHDRYYHEYFDRIATMTIEELFSVQQRWIQRDRMIIGASGDAEIIRQACTDILPVHELSAE
jgi:zinc protease